jgi:nitroimidazol reductase NimA-like FMN-containing flavoprotein (pyridoxamine 5'-phosphate oxidase superfamily)
MRLFPKLEIKSKVKLIQFLNDQPVGRIASIDRQGFPQIIPMNFVYVVNEQKSSSDGVSKNNDVSKLNSGAIYMHSHPSGEKIENVRKNSKVGFEVDLPVCFLPSYYFHPSDASQADTLYISVVIKGNAFLTDDLTEKALALNALMNKYQREGGYEPVTTNMAAVREVVVLKIIPEGIRGKYKIGQQWSRDYRIKIAAQIAKREGLDKAKIILETMGMEILTDGSLHILTDPYM